MVKWQEEFGNRPEFVVKSVMGRRRRVGGFNGKPKYTERLNGPIQMTGTDILKTALGTLVEEKSEHPDINIVLAIHDEVLLEAQATASSECPLLPTNYILGNPTKKN